MRRKTRDKATSTVRTHFGFRRDLLARVRGSKLVGK
jgi:hypothetical protein